MATAVAPGAARQATAGLRFRSHAIYLVDAALSQDGARSWLLFLLSFPHNAVRRELADFHAGIAPGLEAVALRLARDQLSELARWCLDVLAFLELYLAYEADSLFPHLLSSNILAPSRRTALDLLKAPRLRLCSASISVLAALETLAVDDADRARLGFIRALDELSTAALVYFKTQVKQLLAAYEPSAHSRKASLEKDFERRLMSYFLGAGSKNDFSAGASAESAGVGARSSSGSSSGSAAFAVRCVMLSRWIEEPRMLLRWVEEYVPGGAERYMRMQNVYAARHLAAVQLFWALRRDGERDVAAEHGDDNEAQKLRAELPRAVAAVAAKHGSLASDNIEAVAAAAAAAADSARSGIVVKRSYLPLFVACSYGRSWTAVLDVVTLSQNALRRELFDLVRLLSTVCTVVRERRWVHAVAIEVIDWWKPLNMFLLDYFDMQQLWFTLARQGGREKAQHDGAMEQRQEQEYLRELEHAKSERAELMRLHAMLDELIMRWDFLEMELLKHTVSTAELFARSAVKYFWLIETKLTRLWNFSDAAKSDDARQQSSSAWDLKKVLKHQLDVFFDGRNARESVVMLTTWMDKPRLEAWIKAHLSTVRAVQYVAYQRSYIMRRGVALDRLNEYLTDPQDSLGYAAAATDAALDETSSAQHARQFTGAGASDSRDQTTASSSRSWSEAHGTALSPDVANGLRASRLASLRASSGFAALFHKQASHDSAGAGSSGGTSAGGTGRRFGASVSKLFKRGLSSKHPSSDAYAE